jgi:hypothetical protein
LRAETMSNGYFWFAFFFSGVITKVKLTRWINRMFAKLSQNFNPIDRRFVELVGCCQFWTRVVPKSFVSIGKACTLYLSKAMRRSLVPSWGLLWLETGFNDVKKFGVWVIDRVQFQQWFGSGFRLRYYLCNKERNILSVDRSAFCRTTLQVPAGVGIVGTIFFSTFVQSMGNRGKTGENGKLGKIGRMRAMIFEMKKFRNRWVWISLLTSLFL